MNLDAHRNILISALGGSQMMGQRTLEYIIQGNLYSDFYQWDAERHFDNAPNPIILANLWNKGLRTYLDRSLAVARRSNPEKPGWLTQRRIFWWFGAASHSLADFYAHTNWIEIQVLQGASNVLAPIVGNQINLDLLPSDLQSGYYSLLHGIRGCPRKNGKFLPPDGFRYCHETLAKDHPDHGHGQDLISPGGSSYFEIACDLAAEGTRYLWSYFKQEILLMGDQGEKLFHHLSRINE